MGVQHEKSFETEICEYLGSHGWLYEEKFTGYDQERALIPEDVFAWLQATQPEQWARVVPEDASEDKVDRLGAAPRTRRRIAGCAPRRL